jgi:hypothetical protein
MAVYPYEPVSQPRCGSRAFSDRSGTILVGLMSFPRVLLLLLVGLDLIDVTWSGVLILGSLAGVRLPVPGGAVILVAAVLALPGFVVAVLGQARAGKEMFQRVPLWLKIVGGCLFIAFWISAFTAISSSQGGQPVMQGGHYTLDDHGAVTIVDKATYEAALTRDERTFLSVLGGFAVAGGVLCATQARET